MPECQRCRATFLLRDGDDPTCHCDHCAHELVEGALAGGVALAKQVDDLTAELTGLRKALRVCAQHAQDAIARAERLEKERLDARELERAYVRARAEAADAKRLCKTVSLLLERASAMIARPWPEDWRSAVAEVITDCERLSPDGR